jgi:hypothetical protein
MLSASTTGCLQAGAGPLWVCEAPLMRWRCSLQGAHAWWRSSVCRAGAGTGSERCASWSAFLMRTPRGSSSGAHWRGRRHCGGSRWRYCLQRHRGAQRCQRGMGCWDPRSRRVVHTSQGARSAARCLCGSPRSLGGTRRHHARRRSPSAHRRRTSWGFLHAPSNPCTKQSWSDLVSTSNHPHRFEFLKHRGAILA